MVGSAIKKFAKENNLTVKNGVAFGSYKGYLISMSDGYSLKTLSICVNLTDNSAKAEIEKMLSDKSVLKQYSINQAVVSASSVDISFNDTIGTMKRVVGFLDMLTQKLASSFISNEPVCANCGSILNTAEAVPVLVDGKFCCMHSACIAKFNEINEQITEEEKQNGSVLTGAVGALLGGIIGAIPWAIAYYFGWFVGWLGFLIGLAAKKGYELFKGKNSQAKGIVIIIVTVICVALAEIVACIAMLGIEISKDPELSQYGLTLSQIIGTFFSIAAEDSELRADIIFDFVIGLVFAALGMGQTAKDIFRKASGKSGMAIRLDN